METAALWKHRTRDPDRTSQSWCFHRAWKTQRVSHCSHRPDAYLSTTKSVTDVLAQIVNHVMALDTSGMRPGIWLVGGLEAPPTLRHSVMFSGVGGLCVVRSNLVRDHLRPHLGQPVGVNLKDDGPVLHDTADLEPGI